MEDIQNAKPRLHVFICVNDRNNIKPSCGPRITPEDVKDVKMWLLQKGITDVQTNKVNCLGYCNPEGSVICIYPKGRFVKGIQNKEDIKEIIKEEINI